MTTAMTDARLTQIVASYGASPDSWPAAEREAAILAATSPAHVALLREETELDQLLALYEAPLPGAAARHRIAATAPKPRRWPQLQGWWLPGAALAGTGIAGMVLGAVLLSVVAGPAVVAEGESYASSYDFAVVQGAL